MPVISLGLVGDIMAVDDMEDSANEDSGEVIPRVLRWVDDLLHAALSTIHCWQLELNLFAGRAILTPLLVSLSHSYPRGDTANSSWLQMTAFPITMLQDSLSLNQNWSLIFIKCIKLRIFVYICYVPEQFGIVQTIASRELLGKYTLPP